MSLPVHEAANFLPAMTIEEARQRLASLSLFTKECMRDGVDFGIIPGTPKPSLYKPGAEKLAIFFGLVESFEPITETERWDDGDPFFYYRFRCVLHRAGVIAGSAEASANSREKKHRYRWVSKEALMELGLDPVKTISRNNQKMISEFDFAVTKAETTGKYGKPESYWQEWRDAIEDGSARAIMRATRTGEDKKAWERIAGMVEYRVPNPEIFDSVNAILKMAQKRAFVAAVLLATGASDMFTQDLEDFDRDEAYVPPGSRQAQVEVAEQKLKLLKESEKPKESEEPKEPEKPKESEKPKEPEKPKGNVAQLMAAYMGSKEWMLLGGPLTADLETVYQDYINLLKQTAAHTSPAVRAGGVKELTEGMARIAEWYKNIDKKADWDRELGRLVDAYGHAVGATVGRAAIVSNVAFAEIALRHLLKFIEGDLA